MLWGSIICLIAIAALFAWAAFVLAASADDASRLTEIVDVQPWGDIVEIPAAARKAGGAAQRRGDRLAQRMDRTHSEDQR